MNQSEWLTSDNSAAMLMYLRTSDGRGNVLNRWPTDRKLRLFAAACAGGIESGGAWNRWAERTDQPGEFSSLDGARYWVGEKVRQHHVHRLVEGERGRQAALLRDIFGDPWKPRIQAYTEVVWDNDETWKMPASWLAWNDGCVKKMAQAIYEDRAFDRLPLLADCLEDAGCADAAILMHCRGLVWCATCKGTGKRDVMVDAGYGSSLMTREGWQYCYVCNDYGKGASPGWRVPRDGPPPHVRGCWVIDLLTGKE